ncbi:MAG: DALR anticodon-binding domain-containing protein, partial [Endomicrobia bacterium]|nr:DALR anticodon-binding domain-containing protein [Endomicrobiia bacterium]
VLNLCIENLSIHYLCTYLIDVASVFHRFYEQCRVIEKNNIINYTRLLIVLATKIIVNNALSILGITAPEKM